MTTPNQYPDTNQESATQPVEWEQVFSTIESLALSTDVTERASQLGAMTGEGIMRVATALHTVLAPDLAHTPTIDAMHIQSPDGSNRRDLVQPDERAPLLDFAAGLVRELGASRQPGEEQAYLKRAGNVIALSLVLAHPFEDANGRTARTMAHIVREGYDSGAEVQTDLKQVGSNRPPSGFRIFSFLPTKEGVDITPRDLLEIAASIDIPLASHNEYVKKAQEHFTSPYGAD